MGEMGEVALFGADAAIPVKDFVFRLEAAFFPQRNVQTSPEWQAARQMAGLAFDDSKYCEQLVALAGFDWTPSGWTITAQYIADAVFANAEALDRRAYVHRASLTVEKSLFNENLTLSALFFLDLTDLSSATEISGEYSVSDTTKIGLVANLFLKGINGSDGLYGLYSGLSCLTMKAVVSF